jgi:predicted  nucleic acid-binding Zn-ribbon protein
MPRRDRRRAREEKTSMLYSGIGSEIKAINSSLLLISQKMKYLARNEKILGRNLIVLNKKVKSLEEAISKKDLSPDFMKTEEFSGIKEEIELLKEKVNSISREVMEIKDKLEEFSKKFALKEKLQELKYIIDAINPLELATLDQVKELIESKKKKS